MSATSERHEEASCPYCGHVLSSFDEPVPDRSELLAARVAAVVGSWGFLVVVLLVILGWLGLNLLARPFDPHPATMLSGLSAILATTAALQGPVILLAQRRAAARDQLRAREALKVAVHTETDLHAIRDALSALTVQHDQGDHR